MGTQSDSVTGFGSGRGAFTSSETGAVTLCRPSRFCFDETWKELKTLSTCRVSHLITSEMTRTDLKAGPLSELDSCELAEPERP